MNQRGTELSDPKVSSEQNPKSAGSSGGPTPPIIPSGATGIVSPLTPALQPSNGSSPLTPNGAVQTVAERLCLNGMRIKVWTMENSTDRTAASGDKELAPLFGESRDGKAKTAGDKSL